MNVHLTSHAKRKLVVAMVLALGSMSAHANMVDLGSSDNNFTMLDSAGGSVGGTNNVVAMWDGTYNTSVDTAVVNMTISSTTPFYGILWSAHDVQVFGPGSYTFEACPGPIDPVTSKAADGSLCYSHASTPQTMTVANGQVGVHMLFDWNGNLNIDVVNVWDVNSIWSYGPNDGTTTNMLQAAGTPCVGKGSDPNSAECLAFYQTEWLYTSKDVDGNTIPGSPMVDGPFKGFNANFNIQKQVAYDDDMFAVVNTSATSPVLMANDQLPTVSNKGPFVITAFDATTVQGGTVTDNGDGTFGYLPPLDYLGPDSFTYTIDDSLNHFATATVNIDVLAIDPIPVLADDSVSTDMDVAVTTGDVLANDVFPANGAVFTITAFDSTTANGGSVTNNGNNTFTYTPAAGYVGADSFTYTVNDGNVLHLGTATVNIVVNAVATPSKSSSSGSLFALPLMLLLLPLRLLTRKKKA